MWAEREAFQSSVAEGRETYQSKMALGKAKLTERAQQTQHPADEARPSTVGAVTDRDVEVDWKDQ